MCPEKWGVGEREKKERKKSLLVNNEELPQIPNSTKPEALITVFDLEDHVMDQNAFQI